MFSTEFDQRILEEAAAKFLPSNSYRFEPTTGGVNNVVRYIETEDRNKYILRVYNNGNDSHRVKFEHAILQQLAAMNLSYKIPTTVPSLQTGSTHALLSNGAQASLFYIIPGKLPKLTMAKDIGRASGELNAAISKVKLDMVSPNPPYYDIYKVHHAVTREKFLEVIASSDFDSIRDVTSELQGELNKIEELAQRLLDLNLPQQLIHGDLHYDNVLVTEDGVSGLLDFEFCAHDWRVMELAICLSKYAGEKDAYSYFEQFIEGYMEYAELTPLEISVVPDLINLRILSNVVYFVGRSIAKEDRIASITTRAENYLSRIRWINANRDVITKKIQSCIANKNV
ncbi:hypothetical protein EON65_27155 [archaeon]|nr:MAG: hypothetical protein EON65_27155 [archaeon]